MELACVLPAVWLLRAGVGSTPQPAGCLLYSAQLPPQGLDADAQAVLLSNGVGLQSSLRLVAYCRRTGQVLEQREWLQRDEGELYTHPHHRVPAWDSR